MNMKTWTKKDVKFLGEKRPWMKKKQINLSEKIFFNDLN